VTAGIPIPIPNPINWLDQFRLALYDGDSLRRELKIMTNIDWVHDTSRSERLRFVDLNTGDTFRFLNQHGKAVGPRFKVIEPYNGRSDYGTINGLTFGSYQNIKTGEIAIFEGSRDQYRKIKPIDGDMIIMTRRLSME
jgi:hypothetical protein